MKDNWNENKITISHLEYIIVFKSLVLTVDEEKNCFRQFIIIAIACCDNI